MLMINFMPYYWCKTNASIEQSAILAVVVNGISTLGQKLFRKARKTRSTLVCKQILKPQAMLIKVFKKRMPKPKILEKQTGASYLCIMKLRVHILLVLGFLLGGFVFGQTDNLVDSKGRKQGPWIFKYENGLKKSEGLYKDGRQIGRWVYYNEQGKLKSEMEFLTDTAYSNAKFYHPSGKLAGEGMYKTKKRTGLWFFYGFDGIVISEERYLNGLLNDTVKHFHFNGKLFEKWVYKDGIKEGLWEQYFDSGVLKARGVYVKNKLNGHVAFFHSNGRLAMTGVYENDLRNGTFIHYDEDGKERLTLRYIKGELHPADRSKVALPETKEYIPEEQLKQQFRQRGYPDY
ncbi:MAG: toxin-antitoxin system YwqK family antitoxin [Chitinophagia bacterium]|nr:toxin-antitoxin system YwqK family antitoxin [Chitinophagia bacterium]